MIGPEPVMRLPNVQSRSMRRSSRVERMLAAVAAAGIGLTTLAAAVWGQSGPAAAPTAPPVPSAPADGPGVNPAVAPTRGGSDFWTKRQAVLTARLDEAGTRVAKGESSPSWVLLGDSITQGWEAAGKDAIAELNRFGEVLNLGIGGDRTQHVLYRIADGSRLAKLTRAGESPTAPAWVVLLIGTNNLNSDSPEQTSEGIIACVRAIRATLPTSRVLIVGILPRAQKSDKLRTLAAETNAALERRLKDGGENSLLSDPMVRYADISTRFVEADGTISKDVMPDLLHLSGEGYRRFAAAIIEATWERDRQPKGK